ncbi:hypothetical protein EVAR_64450_1 [Eumeta japonica]|uniref:Uncharacterized protein n=1 Tax=Eumeta variegata TaxID=151549 RepID=A0A4C1ZJW5_EUMVA|nr:hypothetical protein EVAR_64450_1 [Eumeta japonica]
MKIGDRRTSKVEERREEDEGCGSLTRTALAAAVGCMDSLISGRQARSVRSMPSGSTMRAALIRLASTSVRPPAVGYVYGLGASLPPSSSTNHQPGCPSTCGCVRGRGPPTRAALAAAVGCVDNLISGRQARSVRPTPSGSPMRAALIRSASTSVRPPAVGCVCGLGCASLPSSSSTNHQAGAPLHLLAAHVRRPRALAYRARPRVMWRRHRHNARKNGSNHSY